MKAGLKVWPESDGTINGIPAYVHPLLAAGTLLRFLKDTPQEYVLVDSLETLEIALRAIRGCA